MNNSFIPKKQSWNFIKSKAADGLKMDYETLAGYFRAFVIEGSTKHYVNLFTPGNKKVVGQPNTNNADYQDFIDNYKSTIDASPPALVTPVDLPQSMKLGSKIQFHESSRPDSLTKQYVTCWAGSGDDVANHVIWGGDPIAIENEVGVSSKWVDVKFDPAFGEIWLHEGYAMWENAGFGDTLSVHAIAPAAPLQQVANLDLVVDGELVKYSTGGPGTGTHGFASMDIAPVQNLTNEGFWNYSPEAGLTPNFAGTGEFDIFTVDKSINQFVANIPIAGTTYSYVMLQSADSTRVIPPYFIRVKTKNITNGNWRIWMFLTLYRERTR